MYPVSAGFLANIGNNPAIHVRVDAYLQGDLVQGDLPIVDGQVTVNSGTGVRRTLDATFSDPRQELWDLLNTPGIELYASRGFHFPNGTSERAPLGIFRVETHSMSASPSGTTSVRSCPDRWVRMQRRKFEKPENSVEGALVKNEIARLCLAASGITFDVSGCSSTATMSLMVYEWDYEKPIVDLATSIGAEVFFNVNGTGVIRDRPKLSANAVWKVSAGDPNGNLVTYSRTRDKSEACNVVIFLTQTADDEDPVDPVVVADTDPNSPTYVGGALGRVPFRHTSPVMMQLSERTAAATAILNKVKSSNASIDIQSLVNPALDRGDVILVQNEYGTLERYLVIGLNVPFTTEGIQTITTESSRPEGSVPAGE